LVVDRRELVAVEADRAVADLESFLAERGQQLLRAAVLLAGSREAGEDLFQAALERLLRRWRMIEGEPEGYLRRILYHLAVDSWRHQEKARAQLRLLRGWAARAQPDAMAEVDTRDSLVRLLGVSVGTVKSAASRGLSRLRELSAAGEGTESRRAGRAGPEGTPAREATP
jgi:DNA-directed RNA polymerase specialized sigma24 family protein